MARLLIAAAGAAATAVAGGAGYFVVQRGASPAAVEPTAQEQTRVAATSTSAAPTGSAAGDAAQDRVCLSGAQFVERQSDGCYSKAEFEAMRDRAVVGADGAPIAMEMSHPTDTAAPPALVSTCVEYDMRARAGWYPMSNAEMRRADYFRRACPILKIAAGAAPATVSHFEGGRLSAPDAAALASHPAFGFAAAPEVAEAAGEAAWTISDSQRKATIEVLSHADFDGDAVGDLLIFVSMRIENGAGRAMTGVASKLEEGAAPAFRPLSAE